MTEYKFKSGLCIGDYCLGSVEKIADAPVATQGNEQDPYTSLGVLGETARDVGVNIPEKLSIPINGSDMSTELRRLLNKLTIVKFTENDPSPVAGSMRWKIHKYPGDIDMFERIQLEQTDRESAAQEAVTRLQQLANDIATDRTIIWADFKAGYDRRFQNLVDNMGDLKVEYQNFEMVGAFEKNITGYDKQTVTDEINGLLASGAISQSAHSELLGLVPDNMTGDVYTKMFRIIRKRRLLRWRITDVIAGRIVIPSNNSQPDHVVHLVDAIKDKTLTKLDLWINVQGRWTEVTNLILFQYKEGGRTAYVGFEFPPSYIAELDKDIAFFSTPGNYNPHKILKKTWNKVVAKLAGSVDPDTRVFNLDKANKKDVQDLESIFTYYSSDHNILGQVNADLELLIMALEKRKEFNLTYSMIFRDLLEMLDTIPQRIFRSALIRTDVSDTIKQQSKNILQSVYSATQSSGYSDITDDKWNQYITDDKVDQLLDQLNALFKTCKQYQNEFADKFLKRIRKGVVKVPSSTPEQQHYSQAKADYKWLASVSAILAFVFYMA